MEILGNTNVTYVDILGLMIGIKFWSTDHWNKGRCWNQGKTIHSIVLVSKVPNPILVEPLPFHNKTDGVESRQISWTKP